ncbi:MAG TPA: prepilin-type N-terminal cleavage/methylation domain-containing protein [Verrucomicrobiae bacterium]|nr:prepilin-type N-terminal cleavage/methylation domain-containing protein [Verrucomicrobiae bacterium]
MRLTHKRMKLLTNYFLGGRSGRSACAFTLVEMMVTVAVFALVVIAMISLQVFGLRVNSITTAKTRFTGDSLKSLDQIRGLVWGATNSVQIGNFNTGTGKFTPVASTNAQIGNALQISNNASDYTTFYLNTSSNILYKKILTNTATPIAHSVVNSQPFQAEDYKGSNIVAGSEHYTIHMTLSFSNMNYSVPTNVQDFYQLETRATPRSQY